VPSSTDRSEDALPKPELNPLLNPLLADNMGRWAEVYFTSAPEKREEAVLELLRELEAKNSIQGSATSPKPASTIPIERPVPPVARATAENRREDLQRCETCGHDNPPRHQFCGMCGMQLGVGAAQPLRANEIGRHERVGRERAQPRAYTQSYPEPEEAIVEEDSFPPQGETARDPYDLSLFQNLREKDFRGYLAREQSPSVRYRYYIGAILAILILVLGYFAWRGSNESQNVQGAPPPAPPAATDTAPAPTTSKAPPSSSVPPPKAVEPQAPPAAQKTSEPAASQSAETKQPPDPLASAGRTPTAAPQAPMQPAAQTVGAQTWSGNGSEELAMAQRYLAGRPRDSAEAAKWLWKAIAKHNGSAMVPLADLYLKGDGVSKNCDQARVLLDSAAQRGMAGAGERLRSLQAFGCQ
jgi:hypothetical protein